MILVRVRDGVRHHFPARKAEWACAFMSLGIGIQFLQPESTFALSRAYAGMAAMAPEGVWGAACFGVGAIRLAALIINGTFAESWYGRWSPHVRASLAALACFVWTTLWIGVVNSATPASLGLAIWPVVLFLDIANVVQATHDARDQDMRARNART